MFHRISEKLVRYAVSQGMCEEEKSEEYVYGLELIWAMLANTAAAAVIGILMGMAAETFFFWFVYVVLKKYTGGFHFESSFACWLSTCIMTPLALLFMKYCPYNEIWYTVSAVISAAVLLALSPVEAVHKPLGKRERQVFGRIARILVCAAVAVYIVCLICGADYAQKLLTAALAAEAVFVAAGKIKEKYAAK